MKLFPFEKNSNRVVLWKQTLSSINSAARHILRDSDIFVRQAGFFPLKEKNDRFVGHFQLFLFGRDDSVSIEHVSSLNDKVLPCRVGAPEGAGGREGDSGEYKSS